MKISELRTNQSRVDIEADVVEVGETREFERFGRSIKVATATVEDDSGKISLSLWNEDVDRVKKGDKIKVTNGFVKEFQGEMQLTAGKFGKLEVLGKAKAGKGKHAKAEETEVIQVGETEESVESEAVKDSVVEEDLEEEVEEADETEEVY